MRKNRTVASRKRKTTNYPTYFIRHTKKLKVEDSTLVSLRKQHRIAIHFPWTEAKENFSRPDSRSTNPTVYKKENARRALRSFNELAMAGGYVCAEFRDTEDCVIGFVRPRTKIQIFKGRWRERDRTAMLKSLALVKAKLVAKKGLVHVLVCRPQQGTISKWHTVKNYVENLVTGKGPGRQDKFGSLTFGQQEVMCAEFLRSHDPGDGLPVMKHLLVPIGGQMKDIDIFGAGANGRRIIAQVTHNRLQKAKSKLRRLETYRDPGNAVCILFCGDDARSEHDGTLIVPLREVYDEFVRTEAGRAWQKDSFALFQNMTFKPRRTRTR